MSLHPTTFDSGYFTASLYADITAEGRFDFHTELRQEVDGQHYLIATSRCRLGEGRVKPILLIQDKTECLEIDLMLRAAHRTDAAMKTHCKPIVTDNGSIKAWLGFQHENSDWVDQDEFASVEMQYIESFSLKDLSQTACAASFDVS